MDYFPVILVFTGSGMCAVSGLNVLDNPTLSLGNIGMIVFSELLATVFLILGIFMAIDIHKTK